MLQEAGELATHPKMKLLCEVGQFHRKVSWPSDCRISSLVDAQLLRFPPPPLSRLEIHVGRRNQHTTTRTGNKKKQRGEIDRGGGHTSLMYPRVYTTLHYTTPSIYQPTCLVCLMCLYVFISLVADPASHGIVRQGPGHESCVACRTYTNHIYIHTYIQSGVLVGFNRLAAGTLGGGREITHSLTHSIPHTV